MTHNTRTTATATTTRSDKHTSNARRLEGGDEAADHRGAGDARDDLGARRRERGEHADLDAERAEVREPAERVGRDRVRAVGERV